MTWLATSRAIVPRLVKSIDGVEQDLHNKVLSPSLNDGDLRHTPDVFTELGVYLVGVSPRGDGTLARGERGTPHVLALEFPVLVVGAGTSAFTGVHAVL